MKNGPWASFLDGIGNGLGYSLILVAVGVVRELFGSGTLLGYADSAAVDRGWLVRGQRLVAVAAQCVLPDRAVHLGLAHLEARSSRGGVACWRNT